MADRVSPGIYVEEVPRGDRLIAAPSSTLAAFVGRTRRGPVDMPVEIGDIEEFRRNFGGATADSDLEACLADYFENGGRRAAVVRLTNGGRHATIRLPAGHHSLVLEAHSPGSAEWLRASVDYDNLPAREDLSFNLVVQRVRGKGSELVSDQEIFARVSVDPSSNRYVADALMDSRLVRIRGEVPGVRPDRSVGAGAAAPVTWVGASTDGSDGEPLSDYDVIGSATESSGIFALTKLPAFDLLCIPPPGPRGELGPAALLAAVRLCRQRHAVLVLDPPARCETADDLIAWMERLNLASENAMMCWPRLAGGEGGERPRGSGGAVAGMLARADRGGDAFTPWSVAPLLLRGGARPVSEVTDAEGERLQAQGINAFRRHGGGRWGLTGERSLAGMECQVPAFRSIRIRRLALMIEETLRNGTRWVVFEAPGAELRAQVREQVEAFMQGLAEGGAFPTGRGCPPFFVKCDAETNSQGETSRGSLHFIVGFAVSEPGNYLVFRVSQTVESARVVPMSIERFRFAGT